jgi:pimeloyl-ACP methyl ester carboxylesterase
MQRHRLCQMGIIALIISTLLLFAACGSSAAPRQTATTPTPAITPTPTTPDIPYTVVHFRTSDHVLLDGWLYGRGATTAIICSHEYPSSKADWSDSAPWFAARGYMVLAYDFRGFGDSQGPYDPTKLDRDLLAAIAFARSQGAKKIILLGASLGADISLIVASETHVAGVIALSPEYLFGVDNSVIRAITVPKLIINSEGDLYASDDQQMFQVARPPKALHLYPGYAHGVAIFETGNEQDLIVRILAFANIYAPL